MDKILEQIHKVEISMENLKSLIEDAVNAGRKAERIDASKKKNPYYSDTEKVLYSYPSLLIKIAEDEKDIENGEYIPYAVGPRKSKDIIRYSKSLKRGSRYPDQDYVMQRQESIKRTRRQIAKIEKALSYISCCDGYEIIEMKYFGTKKEDGSWDGKPLQIAEIAERLHMSESTVKRRRKEFVNKLSVLLFGTDALPM